MVEVTGIPCLRLCQIPKQTPGNPDRKCGKPCKLQHGHTELHNCAEHAPPSTSDGSSSSHSEPDDEDGLCRTRSGAGEEFDPGGNFLSRDVPVSMLDDVHSPETSSPTIIPSDDDDEFDQWGEWRSDCLAGAVYRDVSPPPPPSGARGSNDPEQPLQRSRTSKRMPGEKRRGKHRPDRKRKRLEKLKESKKSKKEKRDREEHK